MRCRACNVVLTDFEATRKYATSGDFVDLCNHCFVPIAMDIDVEERLDLLYQDTEASEFYDEYEEDYAQTNQMPDV